MESLTPVTTPQDTRNPAGQAANVSQDLSRAEATKPVERQALAKEPPQRQVANTTAKIDCERMKKEMHSRID